MLIFFFDDVFHKKIFHYHFKNFKYFFFPVVPHITDAIQEWVARVASEPVTQEDDEVSRPEVCIVELGGTIGDIEGMPFVEAFRQFQFRVSKENFCCVHVSLVPQVGNKLICKLYTNHYGHLAFIVY